MAKRPRRSRKAETHVRFVGCDKPGDLERAEAILDQLVKGIARQLAREDHLAEKQKNERKT
jgi:hypothetical protein